MSPAVPDNGPYPWDKTPADILEEDQALERLTASYAAQREDGDPNRTEYGFMVIVTCPNTMSRAQVEADLKSSIGFGSPFVTLLFNVRAPRTVEVATDQGGRL
jgi:hypothetical protein